MATNRFPGSILRESMFIPVILTSIEPAVCTGLTFERRSDSFIAIDICFVDGMALHQFQRYFLALMDLRPCRFALSGHLATPLKYDSCTAAFNEEHGITGSHAGDIRHHPVWRYSATAYQ